MAEDVVTRTWGYCPIVSSADFAKGFAACARLSFNYSAGGPVAQSDSIAARVTNAAAAPGRRCGLVERPQNLSCFFQVEHTPYSSAGYHMGLQHYECAAEAVEPRLTRFTVELAIAVTVVGLLFLLPNLWLLLIYLRRPRGAEGPPAEAEARKQPAAAPSHEVQKVYLSFSDVHYSVKLNSGARARAKAKLIKGQPRPPHWDLKHVLKGVSGAFAPGSLSAIMVRAPGPRLACSPFRGPGSAGARSSSPLVPARAAPRRTAGRRGRTEPPLPPPFCRARRAAASRRCSTCWPTARTRATAQAVSLSTAPHAAERSSSGWPPT
eukprot:scaffold4184_cov120-Isochrysis_galbana.AAC.10